MLEDWEGGRKRKGRSRAGKGVKRGGRDKRETGERGNGRRKMEEEAERQQRQASFPAAEALGSDQGTVMSSLGPLLPQLPPIQLHVSQKRLVWPIVHLALALLSPGPLSLQLWPYGQGAG